MSKFNVNESEKNRIRGLHKNHSIINEQDMDSGIKPVEVDPSSLLDDRPKLQDVKPTKSKPKQAAGCNDPDWVNLPMGGTQGQPNYNGGKNNYCDRCAANNTGPNFPVIFINGVYHYDTANGVNYCPCCTPSTNYGCQNGQCIQDPNGQYTSLAQCQQNCQPPIDDYECVNGQCVIQPGGQYNSGPTSQDNLNLCQANCSQTQTLDCNTGAPMYTTQQWNSVTSFMALADQKSTLAQSGGNGCNWICNKRDSLQSQAPFTPGTLGGDKKQCKLDYINDVYNNTPCQPNSQGSGCVFGGGVTPSANWINLMTNRYNSTTGPGGCWGTSGSNNQSVCGRKNHFCVAPGPTTPMKQAKCDWLTDFINNQTSCGC